MVFERLGKVKYNEFTDDYIHLTDLFLGLPFLLFMFYDFFKTLLLYKTKAMHNHVYTPDDGKLLINSRCYVIIDRTPKSADHKRTPLTPSFIQLYTGTL